MEAKDADIRSETQVALTDDMTERVAVSPLKVPETIVLRTRRRNYPIKITNFSKHSEKVAMLVQRNEVPAAIDLSCYNVDAVRTMTDFMAGIDNRNLRLGANILPDLLQLSRIFRMRQLTELIIKHVIMKVEKGPPSNLLLALNLVSADWSMFLHTNETAALVVAAAENINEVTTSTFFNMLPAAVLVILYSRCDINISSEIELSQRLIKWLKKSVRSDEDAEMLFSCVRSAFLLPKDREFIREKTAGLPDPMINTIERTLDSPRNHRCCIIKDHIERHYRRCGTPDNGLYIKINSINVMAKTQEKPFDGTNAREFVKTGDLLTARTTTKSLTRLVPRGASERGSAESHRRRQEHKPKGLGRMSGYTD